MEIVKKIELSIREESISEIFCLEVSLHQNVISELIILFVLLKEQLVNSICIISNLHKIKMSICEKNKIIEQIETNYKIGICINSLEYWLFYMLKIERDKIAEVGHIDIEFEYTNEFCLTVKYDNFKEISADEMNEMLGI